MDSHRKAFEPEWAALSEEALSGMRDWPVQHLQATRTEMERELDGHLGRMRAWLLERVAKQSQATTWRHEAQKRAGGRKTGREDAMRVRAPEYIRFGNALHPLTKPPYGSGRSAVHDFTTLRIGVECKVRLMGVFGITAITLSVYVVGASLIVFGAFLRSASSG